MTEPLLRVEDLCVEYRPRDGSPVRVVDRVSFDLAPGETLGLAGESGSGKSSLVHALMRTLGPPGVITAGHAYFDGRDVFGLDEASLRALRWRQMSLVFQSAINALNPVLSVGAQLCDVLQTRAGLDSEHALERARELLGFVELEPNLLHRYPFQLSGGMRQRVVIAIALALGPRLLILDEPTTSLDVRVEQALLLRLQALQRELGFAILFITHDLRLLGQFCDRIGVLHAGTLCELGPAQVLTNQPEHPYTRELMQAQLSLDSSEGRHFGSNGAAELVTTDARATTLSVRALCKEFPAPTRSAAPIKAVDGVSFELRRGQIVALVGESGSGKTTLAKLMLRLERPSSGEVCLDGVNLLAREPNRASRGFRRRVQMILQDPFASLNPARRVGHHLSRALVLHRHFESDSARERRIGELLDTVELAPSAAFTSKFPHELSGGQRQRVAIARALVVEPEFIVADEPSSMLDVSLRVGILNLLLRLKRDRGMGILYVTHDLGAARYLADQVLVMYRGQLVEALPSSALVSEAQHPYTRALVAAARGAPPSTSQQRSLPLSPAAEHGATGCPYSQHCPVALARCATESPKTVRGPGSRWVRCWRSAPGQAPFRD